MFRLIFLLWCWTFIGGLAQDALEKPAITTDKTGETLITLADVIAKTNADLKKVRSDIKSPGNATSEDQEAWRSIESELAGRLEELRIQFNQLATGVAEEEYAANAPQRLDLGQEVQEILRPVVGELKKATERPRETEALRSRENELIKQAELSARALKSLAKWDGLQETSAGKRVESLRKTWEARKNDADGQLEAVSLRIEQRERESRDFLAPVGETIARFFRGRGMNLLKSLGAFCAVWFLLRWIWDFVGKLPYIRKFNRSEFGWRLLDLVVLFVTVLLSFIAALLVLYFAGDWLLLTLFIVLLAGIAWTAKNALPRIYEQMKLMLNLGPVRKGERLNFEGVPWQVASIGVYTDLKNESLTGGLIRVSLNRLSELRSRPADPSEAWFPTEAGDWVIINGSAGRIVTQTPEYVQVVRMGGARETFPTPDFLSAAPVNLSHNFRIKVVFGIDYDHQAIATTEVPEIFKAKLRAGLVALLEERTLLKSVTVEFAQAGASSLDYEILADFKGEAAPQYDKLRRAISRICVDVCNEKGWVIPFTQITVHQANPGA